VNKRIPAEGLIRLVTFVLCALGYLAGMVLVIRAFEKWPQTGPVPQSIRMSFVQMELSAAPAPPPQPLPEPEAEVMPEIEEADVSLEVVPEKPKPDPEPAPIPEEVRPEAPVAEVSQEASAPTAAVSLAGVGDWAKQQLELVKYYPRPAERLGLRGSFDLRITVDASGTITEAEVLEGEGHRILREALESMLMRIIGRNFGKPIGEERVFEIEFVFE
jgi:protein TonB